MAEEQSLLKYRVMIVDDEPMAVKAIERIIERNCPAFTVVGTAGNGREALEMLPETKPDLVLTDIAMPLMSGLELAKAARETEPEVSFVVISGYQDFQYMRDAIQTGVLDYLAKPIVPSVIVSMMERVRLKLQAAFYERRNKVLRELCHGVKVPQNEMDRLFPMDSYCAALLRENGLPRRFSSSSGTEIFGNPEENFSVYGRDSMEELHLIPEVLLAEQPVEAYMNRLKERRAGKDSYTTLILYGRIRSGS
ncbi:MAG: response regulator [Blautia sp.]|nr:response regulator [Blautia sp.]